MALSYTDVYTVAEYGPRVEEIGKEIESQKASMEGTVFLAGQKIQEQINILQEKEASIFELLGVSNLQQLNMRIQAYQKATFSFNGSALRSTFTGILETNNRREYRAFEKAVREVINQDIVQDVGNYIEGEGCENIAQAVLSYINGSSHRYSSTQGMKGPKIFPNSFTKQQKEKWKSILRQKAAQGGFPEAEKWNLIVSNTDTEIEGEFTWFDEGKGTGKKTEEEAKSELSIEDIKRINANIKAKIIECVSCDDVGLLKDIIDEISGTGVLEIKPEDLDKTNLSFFVGENINKITGVLGEIQGMYYLRKLLGERAEVIWRGGTKTGSKNTDPHQDIQIVDTFKRTFGIQIKNTSSDIDIKHELGVKQELNKTINFSEGNISTMVSKMASIVPIDDSIVGLLETYYGTKSFNVEYHRDKRKKKETQYLPGLRLKDVHAPEFQNFHNQLLGYESQINSLMSLFAAAFMYLDAFDFKNENDANALFLIGGTAFVAASDVLETVLNDLISETSNPHFTINMSSNGGNIISALSSGKKDSPYTNTVLNGIKLTSAYKF